MRTFLGLEPPGRRAVRRHDPTATTRHRIERALGGLLGVIAAGTIGYLVLPVSADGSRFGALDALYQTVTTVATVGFREVHPLNHTGQVFTMALIILGAGTVLYNLGLLVEAVTEGKLRQHLERRKMDRTIDQLRDHVVICGFGRVGKAAAEHLVATGNEVVVIDHDPSRLEGHDFLHVIGEATADDMLRAAGVDRARALVAALDTDADTVYLVLSARALAPDLVIVARARTIDSKEKLVLAGATRAVNPQMIGGRRLAAFALSPDVAEFLDVVVHDEDMDFRIQQVRVDEGSLIAGRSLAELDLPARTGVQVLAMRPSGSRGFTFNPAGDSRLAPHCVLIGFGTLDAISALQTLAQSTGQTPNGQIPSGQIPSGQAAGAQDSTAISR